MGAAHLLGREMKQLTHMTTLPLTDLEDVELTLIARDVNDLLRAMLGPKGHPDAGSLIFSTMPLMGHAGKTLEASIPQILPPTSEAEHTVLRSRQIRNLCAHYGLRDAAQTAMGAEDPFGAAIQSLTSVSRSEVEAVVNRWLRTVSDLLTARLSKSSLANCRAWLGSHS